MNNKETIIKGGIDEFHSPYISVNVIDPNSGRGTMTVKAVIDTGAAFSLVKKEVIDCLRINPTGEFDFIHPIDGNIKSKKYKVNMLIDECVTVRFGSVAIIHSDHYPSDVIIGMDFLRLCDMRYQGLLKLFELSIPSGLILGK